MIIARFVSWVMAILMMFGQESSLCSIVFGHSVTIQNIERCDLALIDTYRLSQAHPLTLYSRVKFPSYFHCMSINSYHNG